MNGVAVWILIYLLQGGSGETGALRGEFYLSEGEEECRTRILELTIDPEVLAVSECQRMALVPTQSKKK